MTQKKAPGTSVARYCGAKTRSLEAKGPTCTRPAGWGTPHPGIGKCKLHGGSTPIRSGNYRYSEMREMRPRLGELYKQYEEDPDPLNVLGELALVRALMTDFIERYSAFSEALIAWHDSFTKLGQLNQYAGGALKTPPQKPMVILDISDAVRHAQTVSNMVAQIEKARAANAISRPALVRLMQQFGDVIEEHVRGVVADDEQAKRVLQAIAKDTRALVVAS